jgi:Ubiquitin-2 like Rad60 SUMO-like
MVSDFIFLASASHITLWLREMLVLFCDTFSTEWRDEQLPPTNILRLIYQGRFLHDNVTLGGKMFLYCFLRSTRSRTWMHVWWKAFLVQLPIANSVI